RNRRLHRVAVIDVQRNCNRPSPEWLKFCSQNIGLPGGRNHTVAPFEHAVDDRASESASSSCDQPSALRHPVPLSRVTVSQDKRSFTQWTDPGPAPPGTSVLSDRRSLNSRADKCRDHQERAPSARVAL